MWLFCSISSFHAAAWSAALHRIPSACVASAVCAASTGRTASGAAHLRHGPSPAVTSAGAVRLAFASARSAVAYDVGAKALVSAWKERGLRWIARDAGALVAEVVPRPRAYTITFVPPDADRLLKRGYHPAEWLARELESQWQVPAVVLLERTRPARPQRGLGLAERRANVRGGFRARERAPARVALVDDVYTSGATAGAAASALRRAGARHVDVITFARAVR